MSRLLIQFLRLYKSFGALVLFDNISLSVNQGDVFALIGENGSGKTTLLQLMTGTLLPDLGHVSKSPHLTIGFLPQEITLSCSNITVREYIEEGILSELERKMAVCLDNTENLSKWSELHERYEQLGGYRRMPIEKALKGLKLEASLLHHTMSSLSSGQRVRFALAKALIDNPDLLLLDEPTNHLDSEMLDWLEKVLYGQALQRKR